MEYRREEPTPERPSKSQRKRDMHRLQELGEQLVELDDETLTRVPVSDELRAAVREARRITARGGRKRQLQYIGKLMRAEDGEAVARALEQLQAGGMAQKRHLHLLEQWRDRLVEEGDAALPDLIAAWPHADRQHLRQLIRSARQERERQKPPAASRKLFRYLKEIIEPA